MMVAVFASQCINREVQKNEEGNVCKGDYINAYHLLFDFEEAYRGGYVDVVVTLTLLAVLFGRQDSRSGTLHRFFTAIMIIQ